MVAGFILPRGNIYKVVPLTEPSFYIPDLYPELYCLSDFKSGNPPESIDHNLRKYLSSDLVNVRDGDQVIDVGAFIGAVSIVLAEQGAEVIAVEPSKRNAQCIRRNTAEFDVADAVTVVQKPVYSSRTTMSLNLASNPTDNSLIETDTIQIKTEEVETTTIDTLAAEFNISQIDLLKMDAEGVEPEVLRGATKTMIKKSRY